MNLDKLTIAIRPRRDWEAVDLGILMARRWWWLMVKIWCLVTLPVFLLTLVLPLAWVPWVPLLLWWLKPLFERPLLMILSQGVFGEQLRPLQVLKACPRLFSKQILLSLTWRRFSPHRSMDLPVVQLEGLRGAQRSARLDVLHRDDHAPAKWLTLIGVHLEAFIVLALVSILRALIPAEIQFNWLNMEFWFASRPGLVLQTLFYYLAVAAVAPFYVACGFSLYLNRRVKLEGWDIEIAFKQMLIKRGLAPSIIALIISLSVTALPLMPERAIAQSIPEHFDEEPIAAERQRIHEQIEAILAGGDFHQKRQQKFLRFKQDEQPEEDDDDLSFAWLASIGKAINWALTAIASVAELLLWALVVGGSLYFAVRYRTLLAKLGDWRGAPKRSHYQPKALFGMDVRQASLPKDISASAEALWQRQQYRAALALLYRASLSQLLERGLPLHEGTTEQECLQLAKAEQQNIGMPADTLAYFEQLTQTWRALAYGHQAPDDAGGLRLCVHWNRLWTEAAYDE